MGTFRKRGDSWRVEVKKGGVRDSATFPTKREAQDWANRREAELADGNEAGITPKRLSAVLEKYRDDVAPLNKGEKWDRARINRFLKEDDDRALCEMNIHQITPTQLAAWRDRRLKQVQPASVRRDIALLRTVWRYARKEWGYLKNDPWRDVTTPAKGRPRDRVFSDDEVSAIVAALGFVEGEAVRDGRQQTAVSLLLALETAMRSGELISLTWDAVDVKKRCLHLDQTKNGDRRDVPLSRRAIQLLEMLRRVDPVRVFTITDALRDVYFRHGRELAQVEGVTFHDSRATALTRLAKKLSMLELARMVGHRDPRSLMVYYRESASNIAQLLD